MIYAFGLVAMCLAWLMPGHYFPWTSFQQNGMAAIGAWLVALAAVVSTKEWPARVPHIASGAILLATVPLIQWWTGHLTFLSDGFFPAVYLAGFAMCIVAGRQLSRGDASFTGGLFGIFVVAGLISVAFCLVQWLQLGPFIFIERIDPGERPSGNIFQPNLMSALFGMGVAGVLFAYETRRFNGIVASVCVGLLGFGMLMTQSRAAWLFVLVYAAMWLLFRKRLSFRMSGTALASGIVLFFAGVLAWGPLVQWLMPAPGTELMAARWTSGYRWTHWKTLIDALMDSPWLGYGWQQAAAAQRVAVLDHPPTFELLSNSHNQFLDLLVYNGIPLGLLVIFGLAAWAVSRMLACRDVTSWASLLALGVLFAHSMVEFPFEFAYFLLPAGLLVGAVESAVRDTGSRELRVHRALYGVALLVAAGVLHTIATEYFKVEEAVRRVRLRNAGYVQPGAPPHVPDVRLMDGLREYVRMQLTPQPRPGMAPDEIQWLKVISLRYGSPGALMRYAKATALNGQPDVARRTLEVMCRVAAEKHCDNGRREWAALAGKHESAALIAFPPTPARYDAPAPRGEREPEM